MLKVLSVNLYPFASKCSIGYMSEHLFNNSALFEIMELYTNDVETYKRISVSVFCQINRLTVREGCKESMKIKTVPGNQVKGIKGQLKDVVRLCMPVKFDPKLYKKICAFAPDVIYTQGYNIRLLRVARCLSVKLKKPMIIHTLDDWFTTENKISDFLKRGILKRYLKEAVSFSGSPAMTERIHALFNKDSTFVSNCTQFNTVGFKNAENLDILYVGNLTPDRYLTLKMLADEMIAYKVDYKLHVYAPTDQISAYKHVMPGNVLLHEEISHSEVPALIRSAKVVLHAESFDKKHIDFIKYSLSTKIAEYASEGKAIVYLGPKQVGVARFLQENNIGQVYTEPKSAVEGIVRLLQNEEVRSTLAEQSYKNAKCFYEKSMVQKRIYESVSKEPL